MLWPPAHGPRRATGRKYTSRLPPHKAVKGIATISRLSLKMAGAYKLKATDGTLTAATSSKLTITPAAPAALAIATHPTTAAVNAAVSPPFAES